MTPGRRAITALQLMKALQADGFGLKRKHGSYHAFRHINGRIVVFPYDTMAATFPVDLLNALIEDAGWSEDDLRRLGLA